MSTSKGEFNAQFIELFETRYASLFRTMNRLCGEPDLATDLTQEVFVRLYQKGVIPDEPRAWLVTVGLNLLRNVKSTSKRRREILSHLGDEWTATSVPLPEVELERDELRQRVRAAVDRMPERERQLLILRAEGLSYREIAAALGLNEASVGKLLARARSGFRALYEGGPDAS